MRAHRQLPCMASTDQLLDSAPPAVIGNFPPSLSTPCGGGFEDVAAAADGYRSSPIVPRIAFDIPQRRGSLDDAATCIELGGMASVVSSRPLSDRSHRDKRKVDKRGVFDESPMLVQSGQLVKLPLRRGDKKSRHVVSSTSSLSHSSLPSVAATAPPSPSSSSSLTLTHSSSDLVWSSTASSSPSTVTGDEPSLLGGTFHALLFHALDQPHAPFARHLMLAHAWLGVSHKTLLRALLAKSVLRAHAAAAVELLSVLVACPVLSFEATLHALKLALKSKKTIARAAGGKRLLRRLRALSKHQDSPRQPLHAPRQNLRLLSFKTKHIAREMFAVEAELLERLSFHQLHLYITGHGARDKAPTVVDMICTTNAMIRSFTFLIVGTSDLKKRVENIEKMIEIAKASLRLGNLGGVMTVVSVLNYSPVSRLKATFALISRQHRKSLDEINDLMAARHNFSGYRAYLAAEHAKTSVHIPFLGVLLKDLTVTDATVPSVLDSGHLNAAKIDIIGHHLQTLHELIDGLKQSASARPKSVPGLRYLLLPVVHYSEDFLFELSYRIQPPVSVSPTTSLDSGLAAPTSPTLGSSDPTTPRSSRRQVFALSPRWYASSDLASSVSDVLHDE